MSADSGDDQRAQRPSGQTLGMIMTTLGWVLALGIATLLFQDYLEKRDSPNRHAQGKVVNGVPTLVLQRGPRGHYRVPGRINGQDVEFMLDTGATHVAIPQSVADRLMLKALSRGRAMTAAGPVDTFGTRLDSVELGSILQKHVIASINPAMHGEEILLGMSFLKHLELIQRGDTLTLRQVP